MLAFKIGAATLLSIALAQGWLLALGHTGAGPALRRLFPGWHQLLRSHIDYLMMALFLFAFAALGVRPPLWVVGLALAGAFVNPLMFLLAAVRPQWLQHPPLLYQAASIASFIATTLGFGITAWWAVLG